MSRRRAFLSLLLGIILLPVALGWLAYTHRSVSVSCQRASGKVNCSETERVADQNVWTQPLWTAHAEDVNLTTREVDDESNPVAVILRTQNDTQQVKFTSGLLGRSKTNCTSSWLCAPAMRRCNLSCRRARAGAIGASPWDWLPSWSSSCCTRSCA